MGLFAGILEEDLASARFDPLDLESVVVVRVLGCDHRVGVELLVGGIARDLDGCRRARGGTAVRFGVERVVGAGHENLRDASALTRFDHRDAAAAEEPVLERFAPLTALPRPAITSSAERSPSTRISCMS